MGTREVPLGINTTMGGVVVIVSLAVPWDLTGPGIDARLGVLAVGLVAFAAAVVDVAAVAVSVGVAFLLFEGFVEGNHGDLAWHGRDDLIRLVVVCMAGAIGLLIGALRRWRERIRRASAPTVVEPSIPRQRASSESDSEVRSSGVGTRGPSR
jgi:hypothetical protein